MIFNPRSVRFRTTAGAALALFVLVGVSGLVIGVVIGRQIEQAFDNTLVEQARDRALLLDGGADPASLISTVGEEAIVAIVGADGDVLATSGLADASDVASIPDGVSDQEVGVIDSDADHGAEVSSERLRIAVVESDTGGRVIVGSELEQSRRAISSVRTILLAGVPVVAVVAGGIAWLVTGRALAPVHRMHDDLGRIVELSDGTRVDDPGTGDEIAELAGQMNRLLDRLGHQQSLRRQFVSDASHELKSPLANARMLVETADAASDRSLALGELDRLRAIVDDLLFLAEHDETTSADPQVVDLDDVVFTEAERLAATIGLTVDASRVVPARVAATTAEVARAVGNLLTNAGRHGRERIEVSVGEADSMWIVTVDDDGPGVPESERERIFERFSRLDDARGRDGGGTGLGLAIVASVAERWGGRVTVGDSPLGGARFRLLLPKA